MSDLPTAEDVLRQAKERAFAHRAAAAELWSTIPGYLVDMGCWRDAYNACGTACCALGWLAEKKHDGWYFNWETWPRWRPIGVDKTAYDSAAVYFGISTSDAYDLFGFNVGRVFHKWTQEVTLQDVTERLMELPYFDWIMAGVYYE